MKLNPSAIGGIVGLSAALTVLASLLIMGHPIDGSHLWALFAIFLMVGGAAHLLVRFYIHERLELLYRSVHELRIKKNTGHDPISNAADDVQEWADEKREEIQELQERERFRREFIGNLSHELKTPITSIQGYILTLLEGGLEDEKVNRDFLHRANNGVERLMHIVNDLDMISRLESGRMELDPIKVDLVEVLKEAKDVVRQRSKKKDVAIDVSEIKERTMVQADRQRLIQVFTNLFNNAVDYGRKGGIVKMAVQPLNDRLMIDVTDDGIGIAKEHLPRLFERFYRVGTSRARNEGGSGLGLAIVKHIMDAHGESIIVKSEEGKGTTFTLTLKRAR